MKNLEIPGTDLESERGEEVYQSGNKCNSISHSILKTCMRILQGEW